MLHRTRQLFIRQHVKNVPANPELVLTLSTSALQPGPVARTAKSCR
jgi:hypothetical protein